MTRDQKYDFIYSTVVITVSYFKTLKVWK